MRTNRKTEEKKMSMSKNIARLAVTAGLTAALSFGGVMAPVTMAFAAGGSTVTFVDTDYAKYTTYKGIQIFKATVTKTGEDTTVSGIEWAGADEDAQQKIQKAVVDAIKTKKKDYDSTNAQDAADYLNANAGVSSSTEQVKNDNVLSQIAANLEKSTGLAWEETSTNNNQLSGLSAGYWLFLTKTPGKPDGKSTDAFTAPVYAVIDGTSTTTIEPKKSVPTVTKKILDDSKAKDGLTTVPEGDWKDIADSQIGQVVNYRLTGTIASNYATYDSYTYEFTDTLSKGLSYVGDQTQVFAVNKNLNNIDQYTDITENFTVQSTTNPDGTTTLTIKANEGEHGKYLKEISKVDASTQIVVFYKAMLNGNAVIGNTADNTQKGGNPNTVKLTYSNNPYAAGTGETIEHTVADFAFKLNLNKVDQGTEKGLGGAVFTIQSADANTVDQYIASKAGTVNGVKVIAGQLVTVPAGTKLPECVQFTSKSDGTITASGLDAGSYKVTEIQAPSAEYTKADPFTFTIAATYDDSTMKVSGLKAEVSEDDKIRTDIAFCKLDGVAGDNVLKKEDGAQFDVDKGEITVFVGNTKSVGLPLTGLNGVTFTWIAGGAVLCIGVAHLIRSRKQAEESEQE